MPTGYHLNLPPKFRPGLKSPEVFSMNRAEASVNGAAMVQTALIQLPQGMPTKPDIGGLGPILASRPIALNSPRWRKDPTAISSSHLIQALREAGL